MGFSGATLIDFLNCSIMASIGIRPASFGYGWNFSTRSSSLVRLRICPCMLAKRWFTSSFTTGLT